jgi:hypothetical protein
MQDIGGKTTQLRDGRPPGLRLYARSETASAHVVNLPDLEVSPQRHHQGPGKVAIRPYLSDGLTSWPALRDRVGPSQEPDANDRQVRTFGADRDFAGALASSPRRAECR